MGSGLDSGDDHHITMAVGDVVVARRVGDARAAWDTETWVIRGVRDCPGIDSRTQVLAEFVASRVLLGQASAPSSWPGEGGSLLRASRAYLLDAGCAAVGSMPAGATFGPCTVR